MGSVKDFTVPIILLFFVVFAFIIALPELANISFVTANMSTSLSSTSTALESGLPFFAAIILIGIAAKMTGKF